jgi:multiple antibiotic resistance protein
MDWTFALSSLATLIAILDPIGATAIFLAFFGGRPAADRRRAARITATTVLVTAVVAFLWGERILAFFGISIAALKVTGGLIIGSVGASMLRGTLAVSPAAEPAEDAARAVAAAAMVPLGVPIIGGAGTISTVIVFSHLSQNWRQWASVLGVIALSAALLFLILRSAERVHHFIGRTGLDLLSRLMGLILLAMGVQFLADGGDDLFPALSAGR